MKINQFLLTHALVIGLSAGALLAADNPSPTTPDNETAKQRDARMKWWREAKFGLFIHWGVYAVPAGTYKGEQVKGIGEWIMRNAQIPVAEYRAFARQFNPVKYDPDAWAKLARAAGMKYIVITAKHHDGFALFPSEVTDWDVADASPYHRDLLSPLARAARRKGLKFGTYYSQAQDWTNPGGAKARLKEGEGWDDAHKGSFDDYLNKIAIPQTREILTRIRPDIFWWDTPVWMTPERAAPLHALLSLRPRVITNNRLGGGYKGDTDTPEQRIPATGIAGRDWETCMTMNGTWGYKSYDQNWKSTETLIRNLVDIVSKGGNYLLNVGPTAEGEIPEPSVQRLREVGQWMKVNGEAIYATTASPFPELPWGRCTKKLTRTGATLYLHVFNWPKDGKLLVPGLKNEVKSASLLAKRGSLRVESGADGVIITVPETAPDPISSTVILKIKGAPEVVRLVLPTSEPDGSLKFSARDAVVHGQKLKYEESKDSLGFWVDARDWAEWELRIAKPGTYKVVAEVASRGSAAFTVMVGDQKLEVTFPNTGDYSTFQTIQAGQLQLTAVGDTKLSLRPIADGWKPANVRCVKLVPQ